jgi:hypothetical protein
MGEDADVINILIRNKRLIVSESHPDVAVTFQIQSGFDESFRGKIFALGLQIKLGNLVILAKGATEIAAIRSIRENETPWEKFL